MIRQIAIRFQETELIKPFKTALRQVSTVESIYVFVHADEGIGVGEAVPTHAITGDTVESIIAAIKIIEKSLINQPLTPQVLIVIQQALVGNTSAKAAVDMAIYDLLARQENQPLYQYLGGAYKVLETSHTVSLNAPEEMAMDAEGYVQQGFKSLKVKLGDITYDLERITAVREAVEVPLAIDANQGWTVDEAIELIQSIGHLNIKAVEQPVHRRDKNGLAAVREAVQMDIMADESLFDYYDALELKRLNAAQIWNIKLMKTGGIYEALKIAEFNHRYMIGSMMESHLSLTAAYHLALAVNAEQIDFDAPVMLKDKWIEGGISYRHNQVCCSGVGLGINNEKLWEMMRHEKSL